ncbi:MAG: hypothetical protein A2131_01410 [Candidatus Sungbacteria bacterium GWC2_49_10]|uniref:Major facilitator superfamily (MFS) profile domain-containing protein n=2 Tax=Parcubacteria group TaxID=1794811 RepID=A0A0G1ZNB0_9BACT|nr:MAG: hypothetical protein UY60_C0028G0008 [Parcubacteria group bacterium GW2011_GWB1_50_9]KKW20929.1 MAG: hypothetical protein UY61_C0019G0017 [Candidatus Adlerbacteria bacterium GW2011_GWC1_50_9]OGZ92989.1 MAG: hypothetical protein A2131_01410 [Candidatus Sungbacteria bacterium GWC2_49_10]
MASLLQFFKVNRVVSILIGSEFILTTSFGLLVPILSLFIVNDLEGGSPRVAGFSLAIYWITKSVLQIPIGAWLDKHKGEIDDFWALLTGNIASGVLAILFAFWVKDIWGLYFFEVLWGITDAFIVPPFYAIFSRHLDPGREGFEWSLRSSMAFGAGSALGGALGGILAAALGYRSVFLFAGIGALIGSVLLIFMKPYIKSRGEGPAEKVYIAPRRL